MSYFAGSSSLRRRDSPYYSISTTLLQFLSLLTTFPQVSFVLQAISSPPILMVLPTNQAFLVPLCRLVVNGFSPSLVRDHTSKRFVSPHATCDHAPILPKYIFPPLLFSVNRRRIPFVFTFFRALPSPIHRVTQKTGALLPLCP